MVQHLLNYMSLFGRVTMILSDLGTQFNCEVFHTINSELGIKVIHTTSGHPQLNSVSERINTSLKSSLIALREQGISIQSALLIHQQIYNSAIHPATGYSPNMLHFGREMSIFFDTYQNPNNKLISLDQASYVSQVLNDLNNYYSNAYTSLRQNQTDQNSKFERKAKLRKFEVNDIVYLKSKDSFNPKFNGPYTIVIKHNDVNFSIQFLSNPNAPVFKINANRLRLAPHRKTSLCATSNKLPQQNTRYFLRSHV
nr:uncharacterized protein LOC122272744 isoform X1 [Parasteatoda tepidariorum]